MAAISVRIAVRARSKHQIYSNMDKRKQTVADTTLSMGCSTLQENCLTASNGRRVLRGRMAERITSFE